MLRRDGHDPAAQPPRAPSSPRDRHLRPSTCALGSRTHRPRRLHALHDAHPHGPGAGGEKVIPGNIIIRQRGTKFKPGEGVGLGKDHTIWALVAGQVRFRYSRLIGRYSVDVVPHMKYGHISEHKAVEARAEKKLLRAQGYIQQAKYAYRNAGDEGLAKLPAVHAFVEQLKAEIAAKQALEVAAEPSHK